MKKLAYLAISVVPLAALGRDRPADGRDHRGAEIGANFKKFVGGIALGWAQTPEDVAAFVSYLAGPDYMTGQAPLIDGGLVYR